MPKKQERPDHYALEPVGPGTPEFDELIDDGMAVEETGQTALLGAIDVEDEEVAKDIEKRKQEREARRQAQITENRREAQRGKHTALNEKGKYGNPQAGMYLPGFGPVTYSNLNAARYYVADLNRERN